MNEDEGTFEPTPVEPEPSVPAPLAPPEATGPLLRTGVAASTVVAVLASLVPVGLAWAGLGLVAVAGSSELLEHTDGLLPTNFGAGYWLGWLLNGGFLLWAAVRALRRLFGAKPGSSYAPLALLVGLYAVVGVPLVILDLNGIDMPDVLTATFLIGYMLLWSWVVPFFIAAFILRLAWLAWRSSALPAAAMRALTVTGMFALAGGTLTGITAGGVAGGYLPPLGPDSEEVDDELPAQYAAATSLAAALVGDWQTVPVSRARFAECAESLARRRVPSTLDLAITKMMRWHFSRQDATDLAYDALLRACERDAKAPVRDVEQYFWRTVRNAGIDAKGRRCRETSLPADIDSICQITPPNPEQVLRVRRALRSLSFEEQSILTMAYVEGYTHAEIAGRLVISVGASKKRLQRATTALREAFERGGA